METIISVKSITGHTYQYVDNGSPIQGGMKDVYFSPDRSYVIAFFRSKQDGVSRDRLLNIVGKYRERIFSQVGGSYWRELYCWPYDLIEDENRTGLVVPTYQKHFFFQKGYHAEVTGVSIAGKEKEGRWFASAQFRSNAYKFRLDSSELGDWSKYLMICIRISRAVRRMHAAGLAHSDLSYKNVLIDPQTGNAAIIDIDGLVVEGKYPPDVIGTPDFIAPEVIATKHLPKENPEKKLPSRFTDQHALAVMIYMYLLYRHPLRGRKIHDTDPQKDEELGMGTQALFIEHPLDPSNRPRLEHIKPTFFPWADTNRLPYTLTGPYLSPLFYKAFVEGLHNPSARPLADDWEEALIKTVDLLQPCLSPTCSQKWFVFDNTTKPTCPFCGQKYTEVLPILNLYWARKPGNYVPEQHRLMVYHNQYLFLWHINRNILPNEKLATEQKQPVGYFSFHQNKWILVNQSLTSLYDADTASQIPIGSAIELTEGKKILLSKDPGGRLAVVQLVNNR